MNKDIEFFYLQLLYRLYKIHKNKMDEHFSFTPYIASVPKVPVASYALWFHKTHAAIQYIEADVLQEILLFVIIRTLPSFRFIG